MAFALHSPAFHMHTAAEKALRRSPEAEKLLSNLISSLLETLSYPPTHPALCSKGTQRFRQSVWVYMYKTQGG